MQAEAEVLETELGRTVTGEGGREEGRGAEGQACTGTLSPQSQMLPLDEDV